MVSNTAIGTVIVLFYHYGSMMNSSRMPFIQSSRQTRAIPARNATHSVAGGARFCRRRKICSRKYTPENIHRKLTKRTYTGTYTALRYNFRDVGKIDSEDCLGAIFWSLLTSE
jgi:hypothetical protein